MGITPVEYFFVVWTLSLSGRTNLDAYPANGSPPDCLIRFFHPCTAAFPVDALKSYSLRGAGGNTLSACGAYRRKNPLIRWSFIGRRGRKVRRCLARGPIGKNRSEPDAWPPLFMEEKSISPDRAKPGKACGFFMRIPRLEGRVGTALGSGDGNIAGALSLEP